MIFISFFFFNKIKLKGLFFFLKLKPIYIETLHIYTKMFMLLSNFILLLLGWGEIYTDLQIYTHIYIYSYFQV